MRTGKDLNWDSLNYHLYAGFAALNDQLTPKQKEIAVRILKEINDRLRFLVDVGLDYLSLGRSSGS